MNVFLKKLCKVVILSSSVLLTTLVYAEDIKTGCALKKQEIQQQIDYAKAHKNSHQQAGLEKALSNVNEYCTDDSLRQELEAKVIEKQRKVVERQSDLDQANAKGDAKKIAKKQKKLQAAEQEVEVAKKELTTYFN